MPTSLRPYHLSHMATSRDQSPAAQCPDTSRPPAGRSLACWLALIIVVALGLSIDLASKQLAFALVGDEPVVLDREVILSNPHWNPPPDAHYKVLPRLLDLHLVLNRGAVFGIGPGQRAFFVVFTVLAVAIGLYAFAARTRRGDWLAHIAIGCILAGAGGNLFDRIMFGAVRDFLKIFPDTHLPLGWRWPGGNSEIFPWVFNIADVLLLTGIGLLMLRMNRQAAPADKDAAAAAALNSPSAATDEPIDRT